MKKLLAICLSVFMLISSIPAVFAVEPELEAFVEPELEAFVEPELEALVESEPLASESVVPVNLSANGTVRIEAESVSLKCASSCTAHAGRTATNASMSGGAYLYCPGSGSVHHHALTADYVVNAPEAGTYKFSAYVNDPGTYGNLSLLVNGTTKAGLEDNNATGWKTKMVIVTLIQGENTVTVKTGSQNGFTQVGLDYIEFTRVSAENVNLSTTETVRIEAEYATLKDATPCSNFKPGISTGSSMSGGAYLSHPGEGSAHHHAISVDFKVIAPVAGGYTLSAYVRDPGSHGNLSLKVNGTTKSGFEDTNNASGWKTKSKVVTLQEGVNTITVQVATQNGYTYFGLDYIEFTMLPSEFAVGSAAATTIQAESYPYTTCVHSDATTHLVEGSVSSGILTANCTTHTDANGKNNWNITLNVAATGVYEIKTVAGGALAANGGVEIVLDGETIITDTVVSTEAETFAKSVYLTAGVHTYSYTAKSVSGKATATIDYVEVTPVLAGSADPDTTGAPVISFPAGILTGATATVSYTYAETNTNPEGESILRLLYKDGLVWKVESTKTVTGGTGSIDLPEHLVGYEIGFEFIPVDSTGKMGPLTTTGSVGTLSRAIEPSAAAITPSASNFSATVTITNNSAVLGPQNICVILVQYDADGAMLAVTNATVSVENGTPQTLTPSFAKETGAAKVQMFVWDGTGYLDAGVSTYGTPVTYMVP